MVVGPQKKYSTKHLPSAKHKLKLDGSHWYSSIRHLLGGPVFSGNNVTWNGSDLFLANARMGWFFLFFSYPLVLLLCLMSKMADSQLKMYSVHVRV